jgi:glutamyl-tRNA synthetase
MILTHQPARVRFAPSPTGSLHLGGARTALFDYLLAKKTCGQFVLRLEDTDRKRFVSGAEDELMRSLHWLGIEWNEGPDIGGPFGPYRQSERKEIYQKYAQQLVDEGKAYYCFCTPEHLNQVRVEQQKTKISHHYDGTCRLLSKNEVKQQVEKGDPYVIRFSAAKEGTTTVNDLIRGNITVENKNIDDYILVKSDGWALYHLAAAIDDHLMNITHVIRGSEWLPTFPLHHLIHQAFGWEEPIWVHLSVFLKPSGKGKMSKREAADLKQDGYSIFIKDLHGLGYLPEAVVNWIALMGWSFDDHTEFFSMSDLVEKFTLEKLNPSPAGINFSKLDHFNGLHIRNLEIEDLVTRIKPFYSELGINAPGSELIKIAPLIQERLSSIDDAPEMTRFFFDEVIQPQKDDLIAKGLDLMETIHIARQVYEVLDALPVLSVTNSEPPMRALVEKLGFGAGQVFGILRVAVTGQKVSPPLFETMEILGKEKVLTRLALAINILEGKEGN